MPTADSPSAPAPQPGSPAPTPNPVVMIPTRLAATRLPNKPLADIHGEPMIVHVWRRAVAAAVGPVVVACGEETIVDAITGAGGNAVLTRPDHPSGSDRIYEALERIDPEGIFDTVVNLQGDLPTIETSAVRAVLAPLADPAVDIGTIAAEITVEAERSELPAVVALPAALPSSVLERRPDIGAAEAALNASAYDIGVARAQMFPSISLTGVFGSVSPELDNLFKPASEAWSASGGIFQPIFQGGRLRSNVKRSEAVREERKAQYAQTVRNAFREVLDGLQGQTLIAGVTAANADQVAALARATELAELRYDQGDIAYIDLLDVRRGLFQAQIDLVAAQRDALLNTVDLALAVGGGLGPRAEQLSAAR